MTSLDRIRRPERVNSAPVYDWDDLVKEDRVHRLLYTDPAVFDAEMTHIFGGTWVYLAHESQIPNRNDYITSKLGLRPLIVTRDDKDVIRALYNRCTHRGTTLCRWEKGNARWRELQGPPPRERLPEIEQTAHEHLLGLLAKGELRPLVTREVAFEEVHAEVACLGRVSFLVVARVVGVEVVHAYHAVPELAQACRQLRPDEPCCSGDQYLQQILREVSAMCPLRFVFHPVRPGGCGVLWRERRPVPRGLGAVAVPVGSMQE